MNQGVRLNEQAVKRSFTHVKAAFIEETGYAFHWQEVYVAQLQDGGYERGIEIGVEDRRLGYEGRYRFSVHLADV